MNYLNTWQLESSYADLPKQFYTRINPIPVNKPNLVIFNKVLSKELGIDLPDDKELLAQIFSGNKLPKKAKPISQAYAGHQFGHFSILGDGRAHLIGEQISPNGKRFDIQFKGSGPTPYSRNGDGRAALAPMLREYVISEAMYALNIPTTRSLAVVSTGESIMRSSLTEGAILTRIASSHIRVGTFEYASKMLDRSAVRQLADYSIKRHFPELISQENPYLSFLKTVISQQAKLIASWMHVGFIHGVMNTDNMAISGETIDYGPCAFMDHYNPKTVFSSIDKFGRYSFSNQPPITKWNLSRFAECLIPLIDKDEDVAIKIATETIDNFQNIYEEKWLNMMRDKLGLFGDHKDDKKLINDLLNWMEKHKADYTNTFCYLMNIKIGNKNLYNDKDFINWFNDWQKRISRNDSLNEKSLKLMKISNPTIIPRNHKVEEALTAANEDNLEVMNKLLSKLSKPYDDQIDIQDYQSPSNDKNYQTFCGT